jgi:hypothetical protein
LFRNVNNPFANVVLLLIKYRYSGNSFAIICSEMHHHHHNKPPDPATIIALANLELAGIIDRLLRPEHNRSRKLGAYYYVVTETKDIQLLNDYTMPQNIDVLDGQNTVPGQMVALAADGVTREPIGTLKPGSELFIVSDSTIATAALVAGGQEGQFAVTRVAGAKGSVTVVYTAVTTDGRTITNVDGIGDTFNFQGAQTNEAAELTADYGTPV